MINNRYRSRSFTLTQLRPENKGMFVSVIFLGGIILTVLLAYAAFGEEVQNHSPTLRQVIILHRHGARTPTHSYETDPYKDEATYWPLGWGQLTLLGKQQLYRLGKSLRTHYGSFVPSFLVKTVKVDSSDVDRTLMSAGALLAGFFPPQDNQIWDNELLWQPIPIHTRPKDQDNLISLKAPCPRYNEEKNKVMKEFKANDTAADKELYSFVTEKTGQKVETIREMETIFSCLSIEEMNGLQLPEWTKSVYPEKMREKALLSFASHAWNTIMQRLHGGPLLNEILGQFKNKTKESSKKDVRMHLFSGHDLTMVTIWRTLGFTELILPHFGAAFIWELHEIAGEYFVQMFSFNSSEATAPFELHIPNCEHPCPLNMLYDITVDVRPVDWSAECQVTSSEARQHKKSSHSEIK